MKINLDMSKIFTTFVLLLIVIKTRSTDISKGWKQVYSNLPYIFFIKKKGS